MEATKVINTDEGYDALKVLQVIEYDKVVDDIFRDNTITMTYPMLRTLVIKNSLSEETSARIREVYDRLILNNKSLLKKYRNIITDTLENPKWPKWYGKRRVLADIAANETTTELDRAMLALNKMKNIYSRLNARVIKDKLRDDKILTRADYREIVAITRTLELKMTSILKKK